MQQLSRSSIGAAALLLQHECSHSDIHAAAFRQQHSRCTYAVAFTQQHFCCRAHTTGSTGLFHHSQPLTLQHCCSSTPRLTQSHAAAFMPPHSRSCIHAAAFTLQLQYLCNGIYTAALMLPCSHHSVVQHLTRCQCSLGAAALTLQHLCRHIHAASFTQHLCNRISTTALMLPRSHCSIQAARCAAPSTQQHFQSQHSRGSSHAAAFLPSHLRCD